MYNTQTTIFLTPEQLGDLFEARLQKALAVLTPAAQQQMALPDLLTRKETAEMLRISLVTLHKLTNQGILQRLLIDGQVRYRKADALAALQEVKHGNSKR